MNRRIDDLGRIVIPKEIRNSLGINAGDKLNIALQDNQIIITKAQPNNVEKALQYIREADSVDIDTLTAILQS